MIDIGKAGASVKAATAQMNAAMEAKMADFERYEKEVGKWIKQNPILGIGIALMIGMGTGLLLRRRR